jgi:hypothetical protein
MPVTPFNPSNLGANKVLPESEQAACFLSTQLVYPMRIPPVIDLTMKESQKDKVVK